MSNVQKLKDKRGFNVGEIREVNGKLQLHDKHGAIMGTYDPKGNVTKDKRGHIVGKGNLLGTLLVDQAA